MENPMIRNVLALCAALVLSISVAHAADAKLSPLALTTHAP